MTSDLCYLLEPGGGGSKGTAPPLVFCPKRGAFVPEADLPGIEMLKV
jgi:hypothetical protein